nr:TRAP transporter small permease subunit [Synergistaceae bacterium]
MKSAEKFFSFLDVIAYWLAAICVGGMLGCVTLQVIARHTTLSVNWTTELSQYFFLWSTTFASYIAARRGKLIGVEMIQRAMPLN